MSTTITDIYNDPITIGYFDGDVSIEITEDGDTACVLLKHAEAEKVASAILERVGKSVVDISTLKPARDLSFNEGMFRLAAIHKRTVEFRYAKAKGDYIEARRLNPTSVAEDGSYVDGEDPDREAPRRYRLDRVKGEVRFA